MTGTSKGHPGVRRGLILAAFLTLVVVRSASAYTIGLGEVGWDGPGLGSATLSWFFGNPGQPNGGLPVGLNAADVKNEIIAAMATWSSIVDVTFVETNTQFDNNSIDIYWAAGNHGDGNAFDGQWQFPAVQGNVLAHAFGPASATQPEAAAGNIHLDADETWVINNGAAVPNIDVQSIILHELGHSLGLGHSAVNGATMAPLYFAPLRTLSQDDIDGILQLYAPAGQGPGPGPGVVPEPASLILVGLGLLGLARNRRRFLRSS